jgi:hypothetical protein
VLGFVLSFSVILLSVGLVYTAGFGAMTDIRANEQVDSAERALTALGGTFENLQRGDPARASELRLSGGTLGVANGTRVDVGVTVSGSPDESYTLYPGSIVYENGDNFVEYEAGATFRRQDGGVVVLRTPHIRCGDEVSVVSIPVLGSGEQTSVGGRSSTVVKARVTSTTLHYPASSSVYAGNATAVTMNVTSENGDGWDRYFQSAGFTPTGSGFECATDEVYVRSVRIDITFLT